MKEILEKPSLYYEDSHHVAMVLGRAQLKHLTMPDNDDERRGLEKKYLSSLLGIEESSVYFLEQVHGTDVVEATGDSGSPYFATADAIFTRSPGRLLCIRTADCLPIFFYAYRYEKEPTPIHSRRVAGIIHAGWRGLSAGIVEKSMARVVDDCFDGDNRELHWVMRTGPAIGADVYEVGPEVAGNFQMVKPGRDNRSFLNLKAEAGLRIHNYPGSHPDRAYTGGIQSHGDFDRCTYLDNSFYYSHRKGDRERNLNLIYLRDFAMG